MKNLQNHLLFLENHIEKYQHKNHLVTQSTVGWQIDHSLKVINSIVSVMAKSKTAEYKRSFNVKRSLLFLLKTIPRGKARAPKAVQSINEIKLEILKSQFEQCKNSIQLMNHLPKNAHFTHPYFGVMNLKQAVLFMEIHTYHHLKIVRDCMKQV